MFGCFEPSGAGIHPHLITSEFVNHLRFVLLVHEKELDKNLTFGSFFGML